LGHRTSDFERSVRGEIAGRALRITGKTSFHLFVEFKQLPAIGSENKGWSEQRDAAALKSKAY